MVSALAAPGLGFTAPPLGAQWGTQGDPEICIAGTGQPSLDIAVCTRALRGEVDAETRPALFNARGLAHRARGALDRAVSDFDAALLLNPASASAYHGRALARRDAGEHTLAYADFTAAIALFPHYRLAYRDRGISLYFSGRPRAAMGDLNRALDLDPVDAQALAFRGLARYLLGDYEGADDDWTACEAMGLDYLYLPLWIHLARARRGVDGREPLETALRELVPGEWPRPLVLGFAGGLSAQAVLARAEKGPGALGVIRARASRFYLGELALTRGDSSSARARFEASLVDASSTSVEAVHARDGLARLSEP